MTILTDDSDRFITMYCGAPITEILEAIEFLRQYKKTNTYMQLVAQMKKEAKQKIKEERRAAIISQVENLKIELAELDDRD